VRSRLAAVAAVAAVALLGGCTSGSDAVDVNNGGEFRFVAGTPDAQVIPDTERASAPEFSGTLPTGETFSSTELAGDVAVLNFWGSWCAPCRIETPEFQAVYDDVSESGVQFLGVDVKDNRQMAQAFVDSVGVTYPSLFDPRGEVAMAFRGFPANVVPSTILIDRADRVAAVYVAVVPEADLRKALDKLAAEQAPQ
jgi:peroxiredoxin